ncbi:hypothetical protein FA15DRAFT_657230 [Coprinopsis marcescibilis]|uniref:Alpha-type protein kinase domain-containing protein n=1 Tax=Coprinopsis marcescibilis TaxID=230819 RepID=A0A5C3KQX5_COPMA|nr:hypothetical protein FA15DRAFT_657230 [Coprinopsis marcescibilis]
MINVHLAKITDHDNGKYRTGPCFNATCISYPEDTPCSEIWNDMFTTCDTTYTWEHDYRLFDLHFCLKAIAPTLRVLLLDRQHTLQHSMALWEKGLVLRRVTGAWGADNVTIWTDEPGSIKVTVEKELFASGLTKLIHKMYIETDILAAKYYFDIGDSSLVSREENTKVPERGASPTETGLLSLKVSVYSIPSEFQVYLWVADVFMLTVTVGPKKGYLWLVDPLFSNAKIWKFSGTTKAGSNDVDLVGWTCNAFAHFLFFNSKGTIVFVDIQGIDSNALPMTSRKGKMSAIALTLFDLMVHSYNKTYGLGDLGFVGLASFVAQHECNSICNALGLLGLDTIWDKAVKKHTQGAVDATELSESNPDEFDIVPKTQKAKTHSNDEGDYGDNNGNGGNKSQ